MPDAKDKAGCKDSPEDPSGTSAITDGTQYIVVMPTIPGDGNTGTPVVQDEVKAKQSMTSETPDATDTADGSRSELSSISTELTYGTITLDATSIYEPQYLRLSPSDEAKTLMMGWFQEYLELPYPKLILSMVGGAGDFTFFNPRISSLFKHGLINIATTTGAWILTPGSNTGVYGLIGSALKEHIETEGLAAMKKTVLLGLTSWESVVNTDLIADKEREKLSPVDHLLDLTRSNLVPTVDPDHPLFIFVDEVTRESTWRADFENSLTELDEDEDVKVPIVKLLVNGDDGSLEACSKSLTAKLPLVAIAGSSGAAQVIVELHKCYTELSQKTKGEGNDEWSRSIETQNILRGIYQRVMGSESEAQVDTVLKWLTVIAEHCDFISVFDFLQHGTSGSDDMGLGKAILSAICNKHEKYDLTEEHKEHKIANKQAEMRLALAWNMVEYARNDILNSSKPHYEQFVAEENFLFDVAVDALFGDKPGFMDLFIRHGLVLNTFVTSDRLETLYQESINKDDSIARTVKRYLEKLPRRFNKVHSYTCCSGVDDKTEYPPETEYEFDLYDVGRMIKRLLGYSYPNIYSNKENAEEEKTSEEFKDPGQHLFLWAILFNRMDLAELFWKYSQDHVAGAIVGGAILKSLAKASYDQREADIQEEYLRSSETFERHATGILDLCWDKDRQNTSDMLVRISPNWGETTVLSMAYNAGMEDFLAQPACYDKLNTIWRGDIPLQIRLWRIYLFAVMPFMVFLLKLIPKETTDSRKIPTNFPMGQRQYEVDDTSKNGCQISLFMDMKRAFTSPIVKCIHYSLLFLSFLAVYSLFLMTELRPFTTNTTGNSSSIDDSCGVCCPMSFSRIGCLEFITYTCALSMLLEEIRQALLRDYGSTIYVKQRLQDWISDVWNQLDLVSHISFTAAIVLRFTLPVESFHWARIFFCFSLMVYFVRFSQIFYVVEQLGPKIIMIRKMMVDLAFFLVILSLTILTFGVICQSIFYPQSLLGWALVNDVLYKPYFQMYGELFLEEFEGGYKWILLGLYMILTNVLLLNLLIAMFSYTFEKVQERSEILWKYNYYAVVYEHFDRPCIPLLGTLFQMIKNCDCCGCCSSHGKQDTDFRRLLDYPTDLLITYLVKDCM